MNTKNCKKFKTRRFDRAASIKGCIYSKDIFLYKFDSCPLFESLPRTKNESIENIQISDVATRGHSRHRANLETMSRRRGSRRELTRARRSLEEEIRRPIPSRRTTPPNYPTYYPRSPWRSNAYASYAPVGKWMIIVVSIFSLRFQFSVSNIFSFAKFFLPTFEPWNDANFNFSMVIRSKFLTIFVRSRIFFFLLISPRCKIKKRG